MSCHNDLTLDEVLSDPMIGVAMRADHVDPRHFETLLRATARRLETSRPKAQPAAVLAARGRCGSVAGVACAW